MDEERVAQEKAWDTMVDMGFKEADITNALEQTSFVFGKAVLLLLNGLDAQRTKYDTQERFRRHHNKHVKGIEASAVLGAVRQALPAARKRIANTCHY